LFNATCFLLTFTGGHAHVNYYQLHFMFQYRSDAYGDVGVYACDAEKKA
jgi:hypothetical protein